MTIDRIESDINTEVEQSQIFKIEIIVPSNESEHISKVGYKHIKKWLEKNSIDTSKITTH